MVPWKLGLVYTSGTIGVGSALNAALKDVVVAEEIESKVKSVVSNRDSSMTRRVADGDSALA